MTDAAAIETMVRIVNELDRKWIESRRRPDGKYRFPTSADLDLQCRDRMAGLLAAIRMGEVPTVCNLTTNEMTLQAEVNRLQKPPIITAIRDIAKPLGWAIGVHGSLARDIDLIGVPWTGQACDAEALVRAIADTTGYAAVGEGLGKPRPGGRRSVLLKHPNAIRLDPPDAKGHWDPMVVDLSLMPRDAAEVEYQEIHDQVAQRCYAALQAVGISEQPDGGGEPDYILPSIVEATLNLLGDRISSAWKRHAERLERMRQREAAGGKPVTMGDVEAAARSAMDALEGRT